MTTNYKNIEVAGTQKSNRHFLDIQVDPYLNFEWEEVKKEAQQRSCKVQNRECTFLLGVLRRLAERKALRAAQTNL